MESLLSQLQRQRVGAEGGMVGGGTRGPPVCLPGCVRLQKHRGKGISCLLPSRRQSHQYPKEGGVVVVEIFSGHALIR